MTISCVGMAPSRRISQRPGPSDRSTMVVGSARPVGPPSMISGMRSPIWSRTQAAWVHSDAPCRLAAVAVIGQPETLHHRPRNGRVGHAQSHVAGVRRGAQRQLGAGAHNDGQRAGPEASASLSSIGSVSRASVIGLASDEISSESGLCFCRVLMW